MKHVISILVASTLMALCGLFFQAPLLALQGATGVQVAGSPVSSASGVAGSGGEDNRANGILPGCSGDGVHDDTACVQGWINKRQDGVLNLGTGLYLISSALTSPGRIMITGPAGSKGIYKQTCQYGLRTNNPTQNALNLQGAGSRVYNLCIDNKVAMTGGAAINIQGIANSVIVADSTVYMQHYGIVVSGTGSSGETQNAGVILRNNTIITAPTSNAAAIVIGNNSKRANTIDARIEGNSVICFRKIGTATLILDTAGSIFSNNMQYGCDYGTKISPGENQTVNLLYFNNNVLGDTDNIADLYIDTPTKTSYIHGLEFNATWASSSPKTAVVIKNTGGATNSILGVHFNGHRSYLGPNANGFDISAGQNVTIDASTICSAGASSGTGVMLRGNIQNAAVRSSTVGACDANVAGALATAIAVTTSATNVGILTNNNLSNADTPLHWKPSGGNAAGAVISGNYALDSVAATITAASIVTLPPNNTVFLNGKTVIHTINGGWNNRYVNLVVGASGLNFSNTGGNICTNLVASAFQQVTASYQSQVGCWVLK